MKHGLKRFVALLLLICTLASFVVPATFADTPEATVQEFDFVLYDAANPKITNELIGTATSRKMQDKCGCGCGKTRA